MKDASSSEVNDTRYSKRPRRNEHPEVTSKRRAENVPVVVEFPSDNENTEDEQLVAVRDQMNVDEEKAISPKNAEIPIEPVQTESNGKTPTRRKQTNSPTQLGIPFPSLLGADQPPDAVDEYDDSAEHHEESTLFGIDHLLNQVTANNSMRSNHLDMETLNYIMNTPQKNDNQSEANDDDRSFIPIIESTPVPAKRKYNKRPGPEELLSTEEYEEMKHSLERFMAAAPQKGKVTCPLCKKTLGSRKGIKRHYYLCFTVQKEKTRKRISQMYTFSRSNFCSEVNSPLATPLRFSSDDLMQDVKIMNHDESNDIVPNPNVASVCEDLFSGRNEIVDVEEICRKQKQTVDPFHAMALGTPGDEDFLLNSGCNVLEVKFVTAEDNTLLSCLAQDGETNVLQIYLVTEASIKLISIIKLRSKCRTIGHNWAPEVIRLSDGSNARIIVVPYSDGVVCGYALPIEKVVSGSQSFRYDFPEEESLLVFCHSFKSRVITCFQWSRFYPRSIFFLGFQTGCVAVMKWSNIMKVVSKSTSFNKGPKVLPFVELFNPTIDAIVSTAGTNTAEAYRKVNAIFPCPSNQNVVGAVYNERNVIFWNINKPTTPIAITDQTTEGYLFTTAVWPKQSDYILFAAENGRGSIFDLTTGGYKNFYFGSNKDLIFGEVSCLCENEYMNENLLLVGSRSGRALFYAAIHLFGTSRKKIQKNNASTQSLVLQHLALEEKIEAVEVDDKYSKWMKSSKSKSSMLPNGCFATFDMTRFITPPKVFETEPKPHDSDKLFPDLQNDSSETESEVLYKDLGVDTLYDFKTESINLKFQELTLKGAPRPIIKAEQQFKVTDLNTKVTSCAFSSPIFPQNSDPNSPVHVQWAAAASYGGIIRLKKLRLPVQPP